MSRLMPACSPSANSTSPRLVHNGDPRTAKNSQHAMTGLFRQFVFGRLGGYKDVNDADRLGRDPAMRWNVGGRAVAKAAAFTSQMGAS